MIVKDKHTLFGDPRILGHRVGVSHVICNLRHYGSLERVQAEVWPYLAIEQLQEAVDYYAVHRVEIDAIIERDRRS